MVAHQVGHRRMAVLGAVSLMAIVAASVAGCGGGTSASSDGGAGTGGGSAGTGGGSAGTGGPPGTPVGDCTEFVDTYCARSVACLGPDAGAVDKATCVRRFGVFVGCERATTSFSECLNDTKLISCSGLAAGPPASCRNPVGVIPLSTAQMKCFELAGVYCAWSAKCQNVQLAPADLLACQDEVGDLDFGCFFATNVVQACIDDLPGAACPVPDAGASDAGTPITPSCADPITIVD